MNTRLETTEINQVDDIEASAKAIVFKPVGFFSMAFVVVLFWIMAGFVGWLIAAMSSEASPALLLPLSITTGLILIAFAIRYMTRKEHRAEIRFADDAIYLPRWNGSRRNKKLPYSDVNSFDLRGKGRYRQLIIGTGKKCYVYPLKAIDESAEFIEQEFKRAFLRQEHGLGHWQKLCESRQGGSLLDEFKTPAVYCLLAALFAIFVFSRVFGIGSTILDLVLLGGNSPALVTQGQVDRLFTSNFLHSGILHLYFNGLAILVFGLILEKLLGWKKLLIIFLLSCLFGALMSSVAARAIVSVGASGGVFGLMGSLLFINLRMGFHLPAGFNLGRNAWIILLVLNGGLPFFIPIIDWVAHLGGFLTGVLVSYLLLRGDLSKTVSVENLLPRWRENTGQQSVIFGVLIAAFALSFVLRTMQFSKHEADLESLLPEVEARMSQSDEARNQLAWRLVTDRNRSAISANFAKAIMEPVIDRLDSSDINVLTKNDANYFDTYGAILFLQDEYAEALNYVYKAMDVQYDFYFASQISRFLHALNQAQGVWVRGDLKVSDFSVQIREGGHQLLRKEGITPVTVTLQVWQGEKRKGYFECRFVDASESLSLVSKSSLFGIPARTLEFKIAAIDTVRSGNVPQSQCASYEVDGSNELEMKSFIETLL